MKLSERESEILREAAYLRGRYLKAKPGACSEWCTPMMLGGTDGSHHSTTMRRLVGKGLLMRKYRGSSKILTNLAPVPRSLRHGARGAFEYTITTAGLEAIAGVKG